MTHQLPDGLQMYYEYAWQHAQRPTLVFLNGLSQSTLSWKPFSDYFQQQYNVLLIDLIFQGQSDKKGEYRTFEQHAADVKHLVDTLGLASVYLAGISYGSAVAQRFLYAYPDTVAKAILMSTFARRTAYFNAIGESWKAALKVGGYALMLDVMLPAALGANYFENPLIPIDQMKNMRLGINENPDALLKLMKATEVSENYLPKLAHVQTPTLIIQGELDILTTPAMAHEIAETMPIAKLMIVSQKGHTLNLEAIPQSIEAIRQFLA